MSELYLALAGIRIRVSSDAPVTVSDAEAVAKSFPDVFDILSDGGILQVNS